VLMLDQSPNRTALRDRIYPALWTIYNFLIRLGSACFKGRGLFMVLICTLSIHTVQCWLFITSGKRETYRSGGIAAVTILIIVQLFVISWGVVYIFRNIWNLRVYEIWLLYVVKVLGFAGMYAFIYIGVKGAFERPNYDKTYQTSFRRATVNEGQTLELGGWVQSNSTELPANFQTWMNLIYFSTSQMTLTGEGGIIPLNPVPQLMVMLQFLVGILYSVFALSISLHESTEKTAAPGLLKREVSCEIRPYSYHQHTLRFYRKIPATYPLLFIILLQAIKFGLLYWIDEHAFDTPVGLEAGQTFLLVLVDFICYLWMCYSTYFIIFATTLGLTTHGRMRTGFSVTVQVYLSLMIMFASLELCFYCVLYEGSPSFLIPSATEYSYWKTVFTFLYFSVATCTGAGDTGTITPRAWYSFLICCVQMLLGVFLHLYVFNRGLTRLQASRRQHRLQRAVGFNGGNFDSSSQRGSNKGMHAINDQGNQY